MAAAMGLPSKRLILSYVLDWIIIIAIAAAGAGIATVKPYHRPFSVLDLQLAYPLVAKEKISTGTLVALGLVVPGILIFLVVLIFVPGPLQLRNSSKSTILRRKLWEWNTGWMGLALSIAVAFFITSGMKNIFGKARPDLLARCNPALTDIAAHVVGGFGQDISARWTLVSSTICQNPDSSVIDEGFRSFPSGHASFSWSGLLYLTLFLSSKFAIQIPYLSQQPFAHSTAATSSDDHELLPMHNGRHEGSDVSGKSAEPLRQGGNSNSGGVGSLEMRNQAAAPPTHMLVIALFPVCLAIYISATRYTDFVHHGFDILSGALIGILSAWFAFRYYHMPISRGNGWSWGARSRDRAFGIPVGVGNYVGNEGWMPAKAGRSGLENGRDTRRSRAAGPSAVPHPAT